MGREVSYDESLVIGAYESSLSISNEKDRASFMVYNPYNCTGPSTQKGPINFESLLLMLYNS